MNGEDPYAAPRAAVSDPVDPLAPIRWQRILAWGTLIFAAVVLIYVLSGIVDTNLRFYSIPIEEIIASIVSFVLYFIFLQVTARRHFLQLMGVFIVVQIFGIAAAGALSLSLKLVVDDPFDDLVSFAELGLNLLVCLLAYAAWYATMRKPIRGRSARP